MIKDRVQIAFLAIAVIIVGIIASKPLIVSTKRLAYIFMCSYYNAPPRWSIIKLFDNYAQQFDEHLSKILNYQTPHDLALLLQINSELPRVIERVLDLGCGTGFVGEELRKQYSIQQLIGVDLSKQMLFVNQQKGIYTKLVHVSLEEYLNQDPQQYDLITAADVFIYVGDLHVIMKQIYKHLKVDGYFAFSVERLEGEAFELRKSGRFAHSLGYIQTQALQAGFSSLTHKDVILRKEHDQPVLGCILILRK